LRDRRLPTSKCIISDALIYNADLVIPRIRRICCSCQLYIYNALLFILPSFELSSSFRYFFRHFSAGFFVFKRISHVRPLISGGVEATLFLWGLYWSKYGQLYLLLCFSTKYMELASLQIIRLIRIKCRMIRKYLLKAFRKHAFDVPMTVRGGVFLVGLGRSIHNDARYCFFIIKILQAFDSTKISPVVYNFIC
jgi:hypothetical protein